MINFIKKYCKSKTIELNGDPYLTRYYIFSNPVFGLFLHHFHRADSERDLHNHPWLFAISLILRGYYLEQRLSRNLSTVPRKAGRFNLLSGGTFHRISYIDAGLHTLFFRGPRCKKWGFLRAIRGNVIFEEYKESKK